MPFYYYTINLTTTIRLPVDGVEGGEVVVGEHSHHQAQELLEGSYVLCGEGGSGDSV